MVTGDDVYAMNVPLFCCLMHLAGPLAERTSLNVTLDILLVNGSDLTIIVYSGILAGSDILYERVFNDYVSTAGETGGQMGPEPTFVSVSEMIDPNLGFGINATRSQSRNHIYINEHTILISTWNSNELCFARIY